MQAIWESGKDNISTVKTSEHCFVGKIPSFETWFSQKRDIWGYGVWGMGEGGYWGRGGSSAFDMICLLLRRVEIWAS